MAETLDRRTLAELLDAVGGDTEFIDDLVATFLADASALLASMDEAVAADDAGRLVTPAHTLKGNALAIGAQQLGEIARVLEMNARAGVMTGGADAAAAARTELAEVEAALKIAGDAGWVA